MKYGWLLALLMVAMVGCTGGLDSSGGQCNQGLCVKIEVAEPIRREEPVVVTITVATERDVPNLGVSLIYHNREIVVEEPEGKEYGEVAWRGSQGLDWIVSATANQPIVFTRKLHLAPAEWPVTIVASAITPQGLRIVDSVRLHFTAEGARVYYEGTPVPITPGPILMFTVTPGPSPTPRPTSTPTPTLLPTPTHPRFPLTPTQEPYPPATALPRAPLAAPTQAVYP